jgi:hypothetical protein
MITVVKDAEVLCIILGDIFGNNETEKGCFLFSSPAVQISTLLITLGHHETWLYLVFRAKI